MLRLIHDLYRQAGIGVTIASREQLTGPSFAHLLHIDAGNGVAETPQVTELYSHANFAGPNEPIVYFVKSISTGTFAGLASPNRPRAMVAHYEYGYTLAHEIAHLLGLDHTTTDAQCGSMAAQGIIPCSGPTHELMTGCGGCDTPATLTEHEKSVMRGSRYTSACDH
jgi:hypothetical protein